MQVDPDNRLVAETLEADWNAALREVAAAQDTYDRQRAQDRLVLDEHRRNEILAPATDFPRLWHDPRTPARDRKRMVQLILEDVTLLRGDDLTAHVRFKGGASRTLHLPRPLPAWQQPKTDTEIIRLVDRLLETRTDTEVAAELHQRGLSSYGGKPFTAGAVRHLRFAYGVADRVSRLRAQGLLTSDEPAARLGVPCAERSPA
jgi:hypothetical protein